MADSIAHNHSRIQPERIVNRMSRSLFPEFVSGSTRVAKGGRRGPVAASTGQRLDWLRRALGSG